MSSNKKKITQAVILAGGKGERLRPLTNDRPKPMVLVNGKPFIEYLIELLKRNGIEEIVMLLGYLPDKITEHFKDGSDFGVSIKYSISDLENLNGTRIRKAADLLQDHFLLVFGDMYWEMNLEKMIENYNKLGAQAMMTVYDNSRGDGEYGSNSNIIVSKNGLVSLYDVELRDDPKINGLDLGTYVFKKSVLDLMPQNNFSLQDHFLPVLIEKKILTAFETKEPYHTITNIELLKKTEGIFKRKFPN